MNILKFLTAHRKAARSKVSGSNSTPENGPKNGPLTLAVIASVLVMVGLGILNWRLLRDTSLVAKLFPSSSPAATAPQSVAPMSRDSHTSGKQSWEVPAQLSFYSKLTAQEEPPPPHPDTNPDKGGPADPSTMSAEDKSAAATGQKMKSHEPIGAINASSHPMHVLDSHATVVDLPGATGGSKRYMVQVGAFSSPAVAQQWAATWKERGYNVLLKPVARPDTGVIHRLYLGSFNSEKKADELAKRLNTREGIRAFRVTVRN